MKKHAKRLIVVAIILGVWFLTADAYWMSKQRSYEKCTLDNAAELLKYGRTADLIGGKEIYWEECSWVMGAGNYWNSTRGMAYWEILYLMPVLGRYRFD